jgi:endonuclease I
VSKRVCRDLKVAERSESWRAKWASREECLECKVWRWVEEDSRRDWTEGRLGSLVGGGW